MNIQDSPYLRITMITASGVSTYRLVSFSFSHQLAQRQNRKAVKEGLLSFSNLLVFGSYLDVPSTACHRAANTERKQLYNFLSTIWTMKQKYPETAVKARVTRSPYSPVSLGTGRHKPPKFYPCHCIEAFI